MWGGGVLFGAVVTMLLWTAAPAATATDWIVTYQTLIAGLLALIGALITVWHIRRQIDITHEHHLDLIRRNLIATHGW